MSVVAVIPARAGSKGVPGKNLRQVHGRSLVVRAIDAARGVAGVGRIIVSTDGDAIEAEALRHGAEVVRRPPDISGDDAATIDAVLHALRQTGIDQGACVLLQPTSPMREPRDVQEALDRFVAKPLGSVISVCECEHHPFKTILRTDQGARPMVDPASLETPRQQLPKALRVNGAIYINDVRDLFRARRFFIEPVDFHEMPADRSLDIDTERDLALANMMRTVE
ncbi:3-deoxy-manno-octulosonate cytidylyltransferase [Bordetella ansorpii]|uniref:3-deoxy-manno-octulosonate cytidylyltransferase n=1 Tax=Bordetella ansorpii TaxID=288768 RepID=A0A157SY11_9BORD|nr:acylneuraminate cytidylyltransferase family protein [Bordetella ansorpii]SAI74836.1 3-deoxy-manno-octulosonate cytidylyltransferase [Bordetella ansorpii]